MIATEKFTIKNTKILNLLKMLLISSILLIPFDNLPYCKRILGELSYRGAVYPFIGIIAILFIITIKNKKVYFPKGKEWKFLYIFILFLVVSTAINMPSILNNTFKDRSGISKLILQLMVVGFMVLIAYTSEIIISLKNITIYDLRRYISYSLVPVILYGILELLNISGILNLTEFLNNISYFIHSYARGELYIKGIRTVTGEVSYFAMYASFVLPWVISYIFTEKEKVKKIFFSLVTFTLLILMIFSKSRTAYVIIFIQIAMFLMFMLIFKVGLKNKIMIVRAVGISMVLFIIINSTILPKIGGDANSVKSFSVKGVITSLLDSNNMSNIARMGFQGAAVNIGIDNPIKGVGLGQYAFYVKENLSDKAMTSLEVQNWVNPEIDSWPPAFSLYPRIFAEQGIIGLALWILFLGYVTVRLFCRVRKNENDIIGIALLVSFIGILISWWNADTYGQLSFWILLPFVIKYNNGDFNNKSNIFNG